MEIYAPLADRMGMHRIRDELEDLSFKVLNNEARELIKKRLDEVKDDKVNSFNSISLQFSGLLNEHKINAEIIGREKTPFSIWRKVQKKRISLEQITDIIGFRITQVILKIVIKLLEYFIISGIVYQENLKIISLHLRLININHYILRL